VDPRGHPAPSVTKLGRLGLVSAVTYDSVEDGHDLDNAQAAARLWMAAGRRAAPGLDPEEYVLPGRPAPALARMATSEGFDLLVVGSRGRCISPKIFESVARELAGSSPLPLGGRLGGLRARI
jgi:nucleotide-binding universal stress UspA family protein